jgi:hypothetical protein
MDRQSREPRSHRCRSNDANSVVNSTTTAEKRSVIKLPGVDCQIRHIVAGVVVERTHERANAHLVTAVVVVVVVDIGIGCGIVVVRIVTNSTADMTQHAPQTTTTTTTTTTTSQQHHAKRAERAAYELSVASPSTALLNDAS